MTKEVYYAKDPMAMLGDIGPTTPPATEKDIKEKYAKVCELPESAKVDFIFEELNLNPRQYIKYPLPKGIEHTSMSVGDLVKFGNTVYLCEMVGWKKLEIK